MDEIRINPAVFTAWVTSPAGPATQLIASLAQRVTQEAKKLAPVGSRNSRFGHPAGYLRSRIGWELHHDGAGLYADIVSNALTSKFNPNPFAPYSVYNELPGTAPHHASLPAWITENEKPYMRPALWSVLGSA